jgi:hypothetical protein
MSAGVLLPKLLTKRHTICECACIRECPGEREQQQLALAAKSRIVVLKSPARQLECEHIVQGYLVQRVDGRSPRTNAADGWSVSALEERVRAPGRSARTLGRFG